LVTRGDERRSSSMSTVDERLAQHAALHRGVFTLDEALALGATNSTRDHRVRDGRWVVVHRGVYLVGGAPLTWHVRLYAACRAAAGEAAASGQSAACLWSLPGGSTRTVEITCDRWRRMHVPGLVVHETGFLPAGDMTVVQGIPCLTVERTLLSLGAVVPASVVEMAVDVALRRELTSVAELRSMLRRLSGRGRNGVGVLRRIVALHDQDSQVTESVMETRLKQLLRRSGLPSPEFQYEVRAKNRLIARVDAAYPEHRIAIEYDSYEHHTGRAALVRDTRRRNALTGNGWSVIGVTAADVIDGGDHVVAMIRAARARSGARSA